jgi:hypothetical protein
MNNNMNANYNFNINNNNNNRYNNNNMAHSYGKNNFMNNNINYNNNLSNSATLLSRNSSNNNKQPKITIPRGNKEIKVRDFEYEDDSNLINVVFHASTGLRVILPIPKYKTMEELINVYAKKVGVSFEVLAKEVVFLYDAAKINVYDKRKLYEIFTVKSYVITVVDSGNVLGA